MFFVCVFRPQITGGHQALHRFPRVGGESVSMLVDGTAFDGRMMTPRFRAVVDVRTPTPKKYLARHE